MKAIYKIENKINHKIYIGQSNDPERRFQEHCREKCDYNSLIHTAIQKYGEENFSFEILGWFDNYNEKEKFYIKEYNSLAPNGYNICRGGEDPPHYRGEDNPSAKITKETADNIKRELKDWTIPKKNIVKKYNTTSDIIRHINDGTSWRDENEIYPLRPTEIELNKIKVKQIIEDIILTDIPLNQIGFKYGWKRSSAKMINCGKNHHDERLIYPIREHREENKAILNL